MRLAAALAALFGRRLGREVRPDTEVTVTLGAIQALYQTCSGILKPGDEVRGERWCVCVCVCVRVSVVEWVWLVGG